MIASVDFIFIPLPSMESSSSLPVAHADLPPDLVIVCATLTLLQILEWTHRRHIGSCFSSYTRLPFRDRFDWDRRVVNLTFQVIQLFANTYILLLDPSATADVLYGYSAKAHTIFLATAAFYLYDSTGIVMHPSPSSNSGMWLLHHAIAIVLIVYNVSYRRTSAFPAATFLISAASHIPNELRWLFTASNVTSQAALNALLGLCFLIVLLTCGLPPPYLLWKCTRQMSASLNDVVLKRMQFYCVLVFMLIYVPHVVVVFHQLHRLCVYWNRAPEPFRTKKVD